MIYTEPRPLRTGARGFPVYDNVAVAVTSTFRFIGLQPISHGPIPTLTLFPHPQQRRMAGVHEIDDAYVKLVGVLAVQPALEEGLGALGDVLEAGLTAPVPLARIRAELAPKAGLGDDTLALFAILREDQTAVPDGAIELVASSLERIGTAIERRSLE